MEIVIILVVIVLLILLFVWAYNRLVRLRNAVQQAWHQIDVQLKRRYDLIPNLVETVKGAASHERETLNAVTQARANAMAAEGKGAAERAQAEADLSQSLVNLRATAEAYPELRANENFGQLQSELTGTEDRIAYARQGYNSSILKYDNVRQAIPFNIIAGMGNFASFEYFEADPDNREPVEVDFS